LPPAAPVRSTTTTGLINELTEAAHATQLCRALGRCERLDLLCIDELGFVPLNETASELMFQVIAAGAKKAAAVIVTTDLPFSEWSQVSPRAQARPRNYLSARLPQLIRGPARRKWWRSSRFVLRSPQAEWWCTLIQCPQSTIFDGMGDVIHRTFFGISAHGALQPRPECSLDLERRPFDGRSLGYRRYPTGTHDRGPSLSTGRIQHCGLHPAAIWLPRGSPGRLHGPRRPRDQAPWPPGQPDLAGAGGLVVRPGSPGNRAPARAHRHWHLIRLGTPEVGRSRPVAH
jgi:hypothetical protein